MTLIKMFLLLAMTVAFTTGASADTASYTEPKCDDDEVLQECEDEGEGLKAMWMD
jgi:hypothetical protein